MSVNSFCESGFIDILTDFEIDSLTHANETIYGMWPDFTIAFINTGWMRFAAANGGRRIMREWLLGRCVMDAVAVPLRPFFEINYARCLREQRPWEHIYECSSANVYRTFHMITFPLKNSGGLLVVNSLRQESAHSRTASPPIAEFYANEHGLIVQCCHCRRIRRPETAQTWDWVPEWAANQPCNTSHSLCPPCMAFHYSSQRAAAAEVVKSFRTF
jgi:hypothetical protein